MDWDSHLRLLIFFALMGTLLWWVKGLTEENQHVFVAGSEKIPALIERLDRADPDRTQVAQRMEDPAWRPLVDSYRVTKDDQGAVTLATTPSESHAQAGCMVVLGYLLDHPELARRLNAHINGAPALTLDQLHAYQCTPPGRHAPDNQIKTFTLTGPSSVQIGSGASEASAR